MQSEGHGLEAKDDDVKQGRIKQKNLLSKKRCNKRKIKK